MTEPTLQDINNRLVKHEARGEAILETVNKISVAVLGNGDTDKSLIVRVSKNTQAINALCAGIRVIYVAMVVALVSAVIAHFI